MGPLALRKALATIPVLKREDISREIAPIYNEEMKLAGIPMVFHEIDTNGIGYIDIMFDMSEVPEELLPYAGILQGVLGIIDTENYEYSLSDKAETPPASRRTT